MDYDSFGKPLGQIATRYQYAGREWDPDTELYYNRARWYDPQARRFISEDPIGLDGGINLYAYVGNNPLNMVDPYGNWGWLIRLGQWASQTPAGRRASALVQEWGDDALAYAQRYGRQGLAAAQRLYYSLRGLPALRQQYVDAVGGLADKVPCMRQAGQSSEQIARALHAERRALGIQFKSLTPPDKLEEIYARNLKLYGDKLGPSIDWLRAAGKSWDDIINSATRAGGKDLGF